MGDEKNTMPAMQPAKVKLTRLITAEASISGPAIIKPIVNRAITIAVDVSKAVYKPPDFLFLPAAIPAHSAVKKLNNELV